MTYVPLAYVTDVQALGIDVSNVTLVQSLIDSVSAEVREAAGCPITVTESTITLSGVREQFIALPGGPVRSVSTVTLDGTAVTDYKIRDNRLWRLAGWGDVNEDVVVEYTHGFDAPPADITRLVCLMVAAGVNASATGWAGHRGVAYESIDDYRIGYQQGDAENVDPTALPERTKRALRDRFGAGAHVTGGY